ncbi:MAG: hypothetical protein KY461_10175 [Actinobacteria bacterium]|nr:hypothetical protein [Actinomycetota bacterium]
MDAGAMAERRALRADPDALATHVRRQRRRALLAAVAAALLGVPALVLAVDYAINRGAYAFGDACERAGLVIAPGEPVPGPEAEVVEHYRAHRRELLEELPGMAEIAERQFHEATAAIARGAAADLAAGAEMTAAFVERLRPVELDCARVTDLPPAGASRLRVVAP